MIEEELKSIAKAVDLSVNRIFSTIGDALIESSKYAIEARGKRLRPALLVLACRATGGDTDTAIPYAASIELIHTASLILDDIIDGSGLRRGVSSLHQRFGLNMAMLTGVILSSKALNILSRNPLISQTVTEAICDMTEGEALDSTTNVFNCTEENYFRIVSKKTASLFSCAAKVGGLLGAASKTDLVSLSEYGFNAGVAFQIHDDMLGLVSTEGKLRKSIGADLRSGKLNLPLLHAIISITPQDRFELRNFLSEAPSNKKKLNDVLALLNRTGSIEYSTRKAMEFIEKSKEHLHKLTPSEARDMLEALADYIITRTD
ncbi:MAG: polyprenyl synthetase family protein [Promethearchaeota archaeon]